MKCFFDEESQTLHVRCFRNANEVHGVEHSDGNSKYHDLVRVWEEHGRLAEITLRDVSQVLDMCEIITAQEASAPKHH